MRALIPGATTVFIHVCPVLKSLPLIGTPRCSASATSAGVSTARFGAPLLYGTSSIRQAHAYNMDGAMSGWSSAIPCSKASTV